MLNELYVGLFYFPNDTKMIIFGSKILVKKFGVTIKKKIMEDQSNLAKGWSVTLNKKSVHYKSDKDSGGEEV